MPLKLVEPCPSRSAGIWLNSYIQPVQKISFLSTRNYKCSAPVMRIRWTLHRIDSEMQQSNNTTLVLINAI